MRRFPALVVFFGALAAASALLRAEDWSSAPVIVTTHDRRASYLAHATIWRDRGAVSPADMRRGPPGSFPISVEQAASGISCTFDTPGKDLSGDSPKFLCRSENGQPLRLKYWDPVSETGNREVFAAVVATHLMWALGFNALPSLPLGVSCIGCPENPMSGEGEPGVHRYLALLQNRIQAPLIVSTHELDQGWSWRQLDDSIAALPRGRERQQQRTYFDALTLLGVLLQHGDRKPEQQAIYCDTPVDISGGDLQRSNEPTPTWLFERATTPLCKQAAVVIVDAGATFGGAGRLSRESTAKMNFEEWRKKPIFLPGRARMCIGNLASSAAAGDEGEPNPIIAEGGRQFLLEQLHRLSPESVRALFEAARVDQLIDRHESAHHDGGGHSVAEWVTACDEKGREIESRTCGPGRQ